MKRDDRLRYEMFLRVRDFGIAQRQLFPDGSMGGKAFAAVAAAIAQIEASATEKLLTAEEGRQAKAAARDVLVERMTTIARTARLLSKNAPGSDAVFQLPVYLSDVELLAAARAYVREAQAAIDRFVLLGMPKTFVVDLQALVDGFEQAVHGRRAGRTGLAAARAAFNAAIAHAMDAIRTLDIVVANTAVDDVELVRAWKRLRYVGTKAKTPVGPTPAQPATPPPAVGTITAVVPAAPAGTETPAAVSSDVAERRAS
jgi:hypothetical protein